MKGEAKEEEMIKMQPYEPEEKRKNKCYPLILLYFLTYFKNK